MRLQEVTGIEVEKSEVLASSAKTNFSRNDGKACHREGTILCESHCSKFIYWH